jgi:hypothetical protein
MNNWRVQKLILHPEATGNGRRGPLIAALNSSF